MSRGSRSLLTHPKLSHSADALTSNANGTLHHQTLAKVTGSVDKLSSQTWCLLLAEAGDYLFLVFLSPNGFSWLLWLRMALTPALDCLPGLGRTAQHGHDGTKLSVDGNSISGAATKPLHEKSSMDCCSKEQAPWLSGPTGPLIARGSQTLQGSSLALRCSKQPCALLCLFPRGTSIPGLPWGWHGLSTAGTTLSPGPEAPIRTSGQLCRSLPISLVFLRL